MCSSDLPEVTAKRLGVRIDYERPLQTFGHSHPTVVYPCYPKEISLGNAAAEEIYCNTDPNMQVAPYGFDILNSLFHSFYKPYNLTLDFTGMNLYIARGTAR